MPSSQLHQFRVFYQHPEEFHRIKNEVFTQHSYYFETESTQPVIIDAGAHIGLTTLYFKSLYPTAKIIAIEPHPQNYELLVQNVAENQLEDVTTIQAALTNSSGQQLQFHADETDEAWFSSASLHAGAWNGQQKTSAFTVETVSLHQLITEPIDLLKMDIEGAEVAALVGAKEKINLIQQMKFEFHPHPSQSWQQLMNLLTNAGFAITAYTDQKAIDLTKIPRRLTYVEAERKQR